MSFLRLLVTYVNYYWKVPQKYAFRSLPNLGQAGPGQVWTWRPTHPALPTYTSKCRFIDDKLACFALENTFKNIKEKTGMIG